jgi:hypothetical protein
MNAHEDVAALVAALRSLVPTDERARAMDPYEASATIRDLGMFLSSLKRHGTEPAEAVPAVVTPLLTLGRTCGMIPRDTVYHYGPWNPTGARQRQFTDDSNEDGLIHCVRSAAARVENAILELEGLRNCELGVPEFVDKCLRASRSTRAMVESINFARANVDPVFFARVLRRYFEGITLDGRSYLGPAAAHLPLCMVDHFTWGADCPDSTYRIFHEDAIRHAVPCWREMYQQTIGSSSLVTRVVEAVNGSDGANRPLFESAIAVYAILRVLLVFRGRHKVLADRAYDPNVRMYPVGSGGFSVAVVDRILEVTRERAATLKQAIKLRHGLSIRPRASSFRPR